jgi:D-alanine-D-alanine ligase
MRIAVLLGGTSEERDVSLASGAEVARARREAGHDVVAVDTASGALSLQEERSILESGMGSTAPTPEQAALVAVDGKSPLTRTPHLADADVLFVALHGGAGEDGTLQSLLDLAGLPYAGSGRVGCTLSMDKDISKRLLRDAGIPTPDWLVGRPDAGEVVSRLGLPVIVKPASGGSTVGLTLVRDAADLDAAKEVASRYGDIVMYEAFVRGREVTVGILGDEALPVGEIVPEHEIFDYECKYQPGLAQEIFPADLPDDVARRLQQIALKVHRTLRLRDYSRVDFILDSDGVAWCLEANALPGLTSNSLLPKAARAAGISFSELCDRIATMAALRAQSQAVASTR